MRVAQRQSPSERRREREELLAEVGLVPRLRSHGLADRRAPVEMQRTETEAIPVQTDWWHPDPDVTLERDSSRWSTPLGLVVIAFGAIYLIAQLLRAAFSGMHGV